MLPEILNCFRMTEVEKDHGEGRRGVVEVTDVMCINFYCASSSSSIKKKIATPQTNWGEYTKWILADKIIVQN